MQRGSAQAGHGNDRGVVAVPFRLGQVFERFVAQQPVLQAISNTWHPLHQRRGMPDSRWNARTDTPVICAFPTPPSLGPASGATADDAP